MAGGKAPLRVGLAGIGALYWPIAIAEGIKARRDSRLVAFATLGLRNDEIVEHLGMSPEAFARSSGATQYRAVEEMMASEQIDAVALCARHTEHARWVERLAPYGKDIFVAKTFSTTMSDADRIVAAERRHRVRIAVGPSARFLPAFVAAKKVVDSGRIGTPFSLRVSHHHGTIDVFRPGDFYRDPAEGGPELSLGWYLVDLVMHLMDQEVTRVHAEYGRFTTPESPFMDCGKMSLRLTGGAMASCDMYFCNRFPFPTWEMEIVGERGALLLRQSLGAEGSRLTLVTHSGPRNVPIPAKTRDWELFWVDDFLAGRASPLSAAYAREVTRICIAARASARSGKAATVRKAPRSYR